MFGAQYFPRLGLRAESAAVSLCRGGEDLPARTHLAPEEVSRLAPLLDL